MTPFRGWQCTLPATSRADGKDWGQNPRALGATGNNAITRPATVKATLIELSLLRQEVDRNRACCHSVG